MEKKLKNYAFIDASNLIYGVWKFEGWKVDCKKLIKYLMLGNKFIDIRGLKNILEFKNSKRGLD
jgi:hypothetical protein